MNLFTKRSLLTFLVLVNLITGTQTVLAQQVQPEARITQVDVSQFPAVTVYVSITDASGNPWAVDPQSIRLYENDQLVQVQDVSGEGETGPLTSLLVMDVSGSMNEGGKLEAAKQAALAYLDLLRPGDQAGLLAFNTSLDYRQPVTTDIGQVRAAVTGLSAGQDTAFYDALVRAEEVLASIPGRKAIVALTDGLDNRSKLGTGDVLTGLGDSGLSISTIGLGDPAKKGLNSGLDENSLEALASQAGGLYAYADDAATLKQIYELYGILLKSEYRLTYQTPAILRDGIRRSLRVEVGAAASVEGSGYNPGGVLPEIAVADTWPIFGGILAGLLLLLLVPVIVRLVANRSTAGRKAGKKTGGAGKIKIKQPPKIKIK